jgi:hypothetical protein
MHICSWSWKLTYAEQHSRFTVTKHATASSCWTARCFNMQLTGNSTDRPVTKWSVNQGDRLYYQIGHNASCSYVRLSCEKLDLTVRGNSEKVCLKGLHICNAPEGVSGFQPCCLLTEPELAVDRLQLDHVQNQIKQQHWLTAVAAV